MLSFGIRLSSSTSEVVTFSDRSIQPTLHAYVFLLICNYFVLRAYIQGESQTLHDSKSDKTNNLPARFLLITAVHM